MTGNMWLVGFVWTVAVFVVGFFVGGKHKERIIAAAQMLKNTVGKL